MIRLDAVLSHVLALLVTNGIMSIPAGAGTWTNRAGDTIDATVVGFDGRTVLLRRPSGEQVRLPLFSLAEDEQRRVEELFRGPPVPPALGPAFKQAEVRMEKARLMFRGGHLDHAEYAARQEQVIEFFRKACAELSYAEDSEEVRSLTERLTGGMDAGEKKRAELDPGQDQGGDHGTTPGGRP